MRHWQQLHPDCSGAEAEATLIAGIQRRSLADTNAGMRGLLVIWAIKAFGLALVLFRHHLYWRISRYLGKTLEKNKFYCTMTLGSDNLFRFYLEDPFWNQLLSKTFFYETELAIVLVRARDLDFALSIAEPISAIGASSHLARKEACARSSPSRRRPRHLKA
jgi:hypothetical protein